MNRLYFVRHGENPANLTKEFSSRHVDYPLTAKGVLQAGQTAAYFATRTVDAIYASPLKRAAQTADIIGRQLGLPVTVMENFREIDVGELELLPPSPASWAYHDQIILAWILEGQHHLKFPGGDDYFSLWGRMRAGLEEITRGKDGQDIVVVTHGGIVTCTLKDLCPDVDIRAILPVLSGNCSITTVEVEADGSLRGRLVEWASCAHLSGEAAWQVSGLPDEGTFAET